ncbi:DsbA family protein [Micromonospora sp. SL4-19]|uniref:DsbA family protein n=1 Tax=Micromonospora sp. SL4-19 TaxID=3399129 RepID=UPI003A4D24E9
MSRGARINARELRQAQVAAARRRRNRVRLAGGVVIVGLLVAIIAVVANTASSGDSSPNSASGQLVTPANLTDTGAIPVGQSTAPVTLEIYLDYMCPACGKFEQANSGEIDRLIKAGTVKVQLRPISFLDRTSKGSKYSTRAANAMATVADRAPGSVWAFNTELFNHQPEEGTRGLSDDQIVELALKAGVSRDVADAFTKRTFERWVAASTDAAFKSGVQGTPAIKINGTVFEGNVYAPGPLTQAIEATAGGAR